jgi:hypothetical protein
MGFRSVIGTLEDNKMKSKLRTERFFSVELKSKANLKNVTLTNGSQENVLVEGTIGKLQRAIFAEDVILEVVGDKGVLRINLHESEIEKAKNKEVKKDD